MCPMYTGGSWNKNDNICHVDVSVWLLFTGTFRCYYLLVISVLYYTTVLLLPTTVIK